MILAALYDIGAGLPQRAGRRGRALAATPWKRLLAGGQSARREGPVFGCPLTSR